MSTNTIIFDFDGTLVDSFSLSMRLSNMLAPLFGYRQVAPEEVPHLKTMTLPELFKHVGLPLYKVPRLLAAARKEMAREIPQVALFEGIAPVLASLRSAGVELGIVTSNSRKNVEACLQRNQVMEWFSFVYSATNLFGKHRTLRQLLKSRQMTGESTLYVGDETRDVDASKKVPMPVVAVTWGFQDRDRLLSAHPDFVAEQPVDLVAIVRKFFKIAIG